MKNENVKLVNSSNRVQIIKPKQYNINHVISAYISKNKKWTLNKNKSIDDQNKKIKKFTHPNI
jgi:hypothetical protein